MKNNSDAKIFQIPVIGDKSYCELVAEVGSAIDANLDYINITFAEYRRYMYDCHNNAEVFNSTMQEFYTDEIRKSMQESIDHLATMMNYMRRIEAPQNRIDALSIITDASIKVRLIQLIGNDAISKH